MKYLSNFKAFSTLTCALTLCFLLLLHLLLADLSQGAGHERQPWIRLLGKVNQEAPGSVRIAELDLLTQTEFETFDPYLKRTVHYRGVLLRELVSRYAEQGIGRVKLLAIDDYEIEFTPEEWRQKGFLLATRMNGKPMGIRDSGPAKIVMHYNPQDDQDRHYTPKWIWMVNRIEFLEQ